MSGFKIDELVMLTTWYVIKPLLIVLGITIVLLLVIGKLLKRLVK